MPRSAVVVALAPSGAILLPRGRSFPQRQISCLSYHLFPSFSLSILGRCCQHGGHVCRWGSSNMIPPSSWQLGKTWRVSQAGCRHRFWDCDPPAEGDISLPMYALSFSILSVSVIFVIDIRRVLPGRLSHFLPGGICDFCVNSDVVDDATVSFFLAHPLFMLSTTSKSTSSIVLYSDDQTKRSKHECYRHGFRQHQSLIENFALPALSFWPTMSLRQVRIRSSSYCARTTWFLPEIVSVTFLLVSCWI